MLEPKNLRLIRRARNSAARNSMDMGFESGEELLKRREKVHKITTGSEQFNRLMDGGFETGAITEAFGEFDQERHR